MVAEQTTLIDTDVRHSYSQPLHVPEYAEPNAHKNYFRVQHCNKGNINRNNRTINECCHTKFHSHSSSSWCIHVRPLELKLKTFSGSHKKFISFWDAFVSSIYNDSALLDVVKFIYLDSLLGGKARKAITSSPQLPRTTNKPCYYYSSVMPKDNSLYQLIWMLWPNYHSLHTIFSAIVLTLMIWKLIYELCKH